MLSEKLRELRKKCRLTQAQLAEKLSLSPSTIGMYEQGRRLPDIETLQKIAEFFGVSLEFFLTKEDNNKNNQKYFEKQKDVARIMEDLLVELENSKEIIVFNGEILNDHTKNYLKELLTIALQYGKIINEK
ncbi:helix-turn-helix domain-containing protein [Caldicellulosiruptor acetigenus]|uniref:helix-turn-helix domain-containing protein n=1 Tax=Caldicellulosiruptor acetigenus TaxID=301953 RepID=UPI000428E18A|nr:helix-turn-helix transcriptional regulator [Caldicellulosiruptor acetigenus]WAM35864.1 helix-turn-helix domain-containing protein [Caldicellulosiruptor acetigenus]